MTEQKCLDIAPPAVNICEPGTVGFDEVHVNNLPYIGLQVAVNPSPRRRLVARGDGRWAGGYLAGAEGWRPLCCTCSAKPLRVLSIPVRRCAARSWTPTMR